MGVASMAEASAEASCSRVRLATLLVVGANKEPWSMEAAEL